MTSQIYLKDFDQVYDETYLDVLRFIVCNSININDVNDILQEVYMELFKILKKKNLDNINIKSYVISIAANKIKKYYSLIYKISKISLFTKDEYDIELIDKIKDDIDIERLIVNKNEWEIALETIDECLSDTPNEKILTDKKEFFIRRKRYYSMLSDIEAMESCEKLITQIKLTI